jgi:Cu2+-exporting ATPase
VAGTGDVYFDTAAMVLLLFTLGRYPEAQGRLPAMRSLAPMLAGEQASVAVVGADGESCRSVATVQVGDRVRIRPGERIAVDGRVVAGRSECDESILTGQPQPCPTCEGDEVIAGSLNGTGELVVCATAPGSETRWVHIGRLVREALGRKSALGETVDRVAAWFVPRCAGARARHGRLLGRRGWCRARVAGRPDRAGGGLSLRAGPRGPARDLAGHRPGRRARHPGAGWCRSRASRAPASRRFRQDRDIDDPSRPTPRRPGRAHRPRATSAPSAAPA